MIGIFKQKNPANILLLLVSGCLDQAAHVPASACAGQSRPADGILFEGDYSNFLNRLAKSYPVFYPLLDFCFAISPGNYAYQVYQQPADDEQAQLSAGHGLPADHFFVSRMELFFSSLACQYYSVICFIRLVQDI